jgi:hypothetical protein
MPSTPTDIPFLIEQASKCLRLAKQCSDAEIVDHLLELAWQFQRRALELGAHWELIPEISEPSLSNSDANRHDH